MSLTSLTFPFLLVRSKISPQSPASAFLSPRISAPPLAGVHHLSFPVSNLDVSLQWYISVLSASHLLVLDRYSPSGKRYAAVLALSALGHAKLELELNYGGALQARGSDPVTLGVKTRNDLEAWATWLDAKDVKRSAILKGTVGWLLVFEDPDGRFLRLYTQETHDMTTDIDEDVYWLGSVQR